VEGRIFKVRVANADRFAFFLFDPGYRDIDDCCGDFYAWVYSEDWCEYFSACRRSGELDGSCARVYGTIGQEMGRVRVAVRDRSQIEIIDCQLCGTPAACDRQW
jgi:hypothetical protein